MMKRLTPIIMTAALLAAPAVSIAKVSVSINGYSNGDILYDWKGPTGIDTRITVSKNGGSIESAKARAVFHKYNVSIGNQVISAGTAGDDEATHVRAGSLFFGKAKFVAAKKGAAVNNFKIVYHLDGTLSCTTPDDSLGAGYALAGVETDVDFNGANVFSGTGTVDGVTGFDSGTGDLAGEFSGSGHEVSIDADKKINLGKLRDGRVYPMLFFGSTLVSYGYDVPITDCAADFLNTAQFSVDEDTATNKGRLVITPAKPVTVSYDPNPWPLSNYPDLTAYIESSNAALLADIDGDTIQLFERLGDNGSITPQSLGEVSDYDSDGIADRAVVFSGFDLYQQVTLVLFGLTDEATLYMIGETTDGTPFMGQATLTISS